MARPSRRSSAEGKDQTVVFEVHGCWIEAHLLKDEVQSVDELLCAALQLYELRRVLWDVLKQTISDHSHLQMRTESKLENTARKSKSDRASEEQAIVHTTIGEPS